MATIFKRVRLRLVAKLPGKVEFIASKGRRVAVWTDPRTHRQRRAVVHDEALTENRIPAGAEIVEDQRGRRFAVWQDFPSKRQRRMRLHAPDSRVEIGDHYYTVAYVDHLGKPRWRGTKCSDLDAARLIAHKYEERAALRRRGVSDESMERFAAEGRRPLADHWQEWHKSLLATCSPCHAEQTAQRAMRVIQACKFQWIADLSAEAVVQFLAAAGRGEHSPAPRQPDRSTAKAKSYAEIAEFFGVSENAVANWRHDGAPIEPFAENDLQAIHRWREGRSGARRRMSPQTRNHYTQAVKQFCAWLKGERRMAVNPLVGLPEANVEKDRRHDRRAISPEEFAALVAAADASPRRIEGLGGSDRAMMYILAAWTGFRRRELGSLTLKSFRLDAAGAAGEATVTIEAAYAKGGRADTLVLHPVVCDRLRAWMATEGTIAAGDRLFSLQTPAGHWRKTAKMMRRDLAAARAHWIAGAPNEREQAAREASDLLAYQDEDGLFADFHAHRHTFVSALGRAGVTLTVAQKLARHRDPRLTANVYTHLEVFDQVEAIGRLPAPPEIPSLACPEAAPDALRATGTEGPAQMANDLANAQQARPGTLGAKCGESKAAKRVAAERRNSLPCLDMAARGETRPERARRDSNPQPSVPKTDALSN